MNKEKINLFLGIAIIVVLIGITVIFLRNDSKCQINPFIWGAQELVKKEKTEHMDCLCTLYDNYNTKKYSFNEKESNPKHLTEYQPTMEFDIRNPLSYNFTEIE